MLLTKHNIKKTFRLLGYLSLVCFDLKDVMNSKCGSIYRNYYQTLLRYYLLWNCILALLLVWTGWDLNPRPPTFPLLIACKAGILPD